jgi:hypothetical protein
MAGLHLPKLMILPRPFARRFRIGLSCENDNVVIAVNITVHSVIVPSVDEVRLTPYLHGRPVFVVGSETDKVNVRVHV